MPQFKNRTESRDKWDSYFYSIAMATAENSKCLSRQIGAILVKDKTIIATGYNGPPRGVPHCNKRFVIGDPHDPLFKEPNTFPKHSELCPKREMGYASGEGLHLCDAGHAEANCINNAARLGVRTGSATLYVTCPVPCQNCIVAIINAGIKEIVCTAMEYYDQMSKFLIANSSLEIREYGILVKDTMVNYK